MRPVRRWLLFVAIVAGWFGCQKDPLPVVGPNGRPTKFSIQEARSLYEYQVEAQTRANRKGGILDPGEIYPYWEGADYSENSMIAGYDVGIVVDHYFEFLQPTPDGRFRVREMFPRLVSLSTIDQSRQPVALIAYYLTDLPQTSLEEEDPGKDLLNCEPKVGFTGRILYTTLDGHPVAISRHIHGEQVNEAYLWNATDSVSLQNLCDRFNDIAQGIYIRSEEHAYGNGTRSEDLGYDKDGGYIGDVVVVGKPIMPNIAPKKSNPDKTEQLTDPTDVDNRKQNKNSGGSWGNGEGEDSSQSEHNAKISSESDVVHDLLDSLMKDCMGQKLIQAIDMEVTIVVGGDKNSVSLSPDGATITFGDGTEENLQRPYVLLEELIHIYQYQQLGRESFNQGKLNREIEAKVGWLRYEARRTGGFKSGAYDQQLGGQNGTENFWILSKYCYPQYDHSDESHSFFYDAAVSSIRKISIYSDEEKYPEIDSLRNFDCIEELSKDCEQ